MGYFREAKGRSAKSKLKPESDRSQTRVAPSQTTFLDEIKDCIAIEPSNWEVERRSPTRLVGEYFETS
jgi:hypothetical protein